MSSRTIDRSRWLLFTKLRPQNGYKIGQTVLRHARTKAKSGPIVLEKPSKFNPPSHPARLNQKRRPTYYGPALSPEEREMQETKQYPHMMPPKGTFMYTFLTNRALHVWISLSVLFSLGVFSFIGNFERTSPYWKDIPPIGELALHPIRYFKTCGELYKMHVAYISAQTAEKRRQKVEDVVKRSEYRKAHGLDSGEGLGGWTARTSEQDLGPGMKVPDRSVPVERVAVDAAEQVGQVEKGTYTDFEGKKRHVKKWLGIW